MKKRVSPVFAAIVIVVALALGALYFMVRYRSHEIQWEAESQALQRSADQAIRSGRSRMGGPGGRRAARTGDSQQPGREGPASDAETEPGGTEVGEEPGVSEPQ